MKTGTALILPCFLEALIRITALIITGSLHISQNQKTGMFQVAVSEDWYFNENGKPVTPSSSLPSTYYHYFNTLLTPTKDLTHPCDFSLHISFFLAVFICQFVLIYFLCCEAKFSRMKFFSNYILLFESVGSRDVFLNFQTDLYFSVDKKVLAVPPFSDGIFFMFDTRVGWKISPWYITILRKW